MEYINKLLVILYVLSVLNTIRHGYYLIQAWVKSNNDNPQKYRMGHTSIFLLGLSLSYIIASFFTGITI